MIRHSQVKGVELDKHTRCKHYHSTKDIIAIKFKCCDTFYACYSCHQELADHKAQKWRKQEYHEKAILCGKCGEKHSIEAYMNSHFSCPSCHAAFNPGCENHYSLYFE